jgi:2',3'-cyclic-nucleotide 2'-phosphodiesterase (5'-nucleotidase family)
VVVVLSHAGAEADENLARQIPELDLVVGSRDGGTDSLYRIGRTWIARVAEGSSHVQKIDVNFSDDALSVEAKSLPVPAGIRIPVAWVPVFDSLERLRRSKADSVVGELREAWPRTRREGSLGNFLADALREEAGADVGLWPAGAIKAGLPKGRVTQGDLWKATGMFAQVSVFELPGSELKRLIKNQLTRAKDFLFLSGASCTADSTASGGPESQVSVGGKPIQGGDHYRIAIPQGLRENIYDLTGFSLSSASPEYLERWDRDLVLEHVRKVGFKTSLGRVPATYGSLR